MIIRGYERFNMRERLECGRSSLSFATAFSQSHTLEDYSSTPERLRLKAFCACRQLNHSCGLRFTIKGFGIGYEVKPEEGRCNYCGHAVFYSRVYKTVEGHYAYDARFDKSSKLRDSQLKHAYNEQERKCERERKRCALEQEKRRLEWERIREKEKQERLEFEKKKAAWNALPKEKRAAIIAQTFGELEPKVRYYSEEWENLPIKAKTELIERMKIAMKKDPTQYAKYV